VGKKVWILFRRITLGRRQGGAIARTGSTMKTIIVVLY
jgi:hypothetical protein